MSEMKSTSSSSSPKKDPQLTLASDLKLKDSSINEMNKMEKLNLRQLSFVPHVPLYDISKSNLFSLKNRRQLEKFELIKDEQSLSSHWSSNTSLNSCSISSIKSSSGGLHFNPINRPRACKMRNGSLSMNLRSRTQDDTRCSLSISQQRQSIIAKYLSRRNNHHHLQEKISSDTNDTRNQNDMTIEMNKRWDNLLLCNNEELIVNNYNDDNSNAEGKGKSPSSSILLARISETSSSLNITFTDVEEKKFDDSIENENKSASALKSNTNLNVDEHNGQKIGEKNAPIILKINKNRINAARNARKKHKKDKRKRQQSKKTDNCWNSLSNKTKKPEERNNRCTAAALSLENDKSKDNTLKNIINNNVNCSNANGDNFDHSLRPKIHFYSKSQANHLGILEKNAKIIRERKGLPPIKVKRLKRDKLKSKPRRKIKTKAKGSNEIKRRPGRPRKNNGDDITAVPVQKIDEQPPYVEYEDGRKLPSLPMIDMNSKSTVASSDGARDDSFSTALKKINSCHENLNECKKIMKSGKITARNEDENSGKIAEITNCNGDSIDASIKSKEEIAFCEFGKEKSDKLNDKKKTLTKISAKIIDDRILQEKINLSKLNKNTSSDNNENKTKLIGQNRQIHFTPEEMKKRKILHSSEFNPMNKDEMNSYGIRTTIPSRQSLLPTKRPLTSEEIDEKLLQAFKNWAKIPEIAELFREPLNNVILKPKTSIKDRLGNYVKNDNDKYQKIQSEREIITINSQKITPIKPVPISLSQIASPEKTIISNNVFNKSQLINYHNGIPREHKNQFISSNPMMKEQYISPIEHVPMRTINPPHQITSNVSAFNRITYKRPLENEKSSNSTEEPQNKRKTIWKRNCDDSESEDSSMENTMADDCSSKSQHTIKSIGNSQSSSTITTESITQIVKKWCYDGRETISPIANADDNSNSCHSLSSVKTIIFSPNKSNFSNSSLSHANNNNEPSDKCTEINENMDLEILNNDDSCDSSSSSTSSYSSTIPSTSSSATQSLVIDLVDDIPVNNNQKDNAGHLSLINSPAKSLIIDLPDDSNAKNDDYNQSLSSSSRNSSVISLCDDLHIPDDNKEEEKSQNEIVNHTNEISNGNYNVNDNNSINNNFNNNNNNNNNQFDLDPEDEEKIDDCDVISLYAESIENLQLDDIDIKDDPEDESIYSSSSLNRYNLMKSENIGRYVSQNVREFDALYNINENNDDENNNMPNARPKGVFSRLQPLNSATEESQIINNNSNISTQNSTDHQQFNCQSTVRHYSYNNFINYNETQQKFRGYCYSILKRNTCNKCDCKFKHTIEDYLLCLHLGNIYEIKSVLNYAIQERFIYYLKLVYENSIKKLDLPDIIEVFSSILSLNFPHVIYECFNSTLKIIPKRSNKMLQFIDGICENIQPSTNITDDKVTLILIDSLKKYIEPGKYWEYLRNLILKMAFPTPEIIELILDECLRHKKSPQYIHDIRKSIINNADENVLTEINSLIMNNFMKLVEDLQNFDESSPKQNDNTEIVSSIASPDLINNNNNSDKINTKEQNGGITENIPPIKRISTDLRNRLGIKQPDDSTKWKLIKIDNIDKPNSVFKKRLERLRDDLTLLSTALDEKNYETILGILTIAKGCSLQEHIFAYGKGFYEILCNSIMVAPEHLEKIILITVENGRVPHYLSTMLMNIGINILQKLINFGAWIIAKKLLKLLHFYHGKNNVNIIYNELTSASFILLSAEIYIANQRPKKAFELIKQNNLMKKDRNKWKVDSKNDDEKLRIIILKLLLKSLSLNHVDHAFLLYMTILKDQRNSFRPLDLSMFTDCIILGLLRDGRDDELIEMIDLIFEYYLFASPMTIRAMIRKIFHLDEILSRRLFIYASRIGIYPTLKGLRNVGYFLLTINIDWIEEEMYLVVEDCLCALHKELGNNLHGIKSRKLLIFLNFQQMYPSSEQMYDDNVNNGKLNNSKLFVNAKKKLQKTLQKFNPPLKFNAHYQSYQLCKFVSSTVINYIKERYINNNQKEN
ncbi:hypothetical protein PV325_000498, partial [Microctonus aethiopoides]